MYTCLLELDIFEDNKMLEGKQYMGTYRTVVEVPTPPVKQEQYIVTGLKASVQTFIWNIDTQMYEVVLNPIIVNEFNARGTVTSMMYWHKQIGDKWEGPMREGYSEVHNEGKMVAQS